MITRINKIKNSALLLLIGVLIVSITGCGTTARHTSIDLTDVERDNRGQGNAVGRIEQGRDSGSIDWTGGTPIY